MDKEKIGKRLVTIRLSEEEISIIRSFGEEVGVGNFSEAVRLMVKVVKGLMERGS